MLGTPIENLTLTGEVANYAMPEIHGGNYKGDSSMLAVARLLLYPRGFTLGMTCISYNTEDDGPDDSAYDRVINSMGDNSLLFIYCTDDGSLIDYLLHKVQMPGYKYLERPSEWLTDCCKWGGTRRQVACWVDPDHHKSVIVAHNIRFSGYHAVVGSLPAFLPWVFREQKPTDEERNLLCMFPARTTSTGQVVAKIEDMSSKFDLQSAAKKYYLEDFESSALRIYRRDLENSISNLMDNIRCLSDELRNTYEKKSIKDAELFSIVNAIGEKRHELMDYFVANQSLFVEGKDGSNIVYYVSGYCNDWDPDTYELIRDNANGLIYQAYNSYADRGAISKDQFVELLNAIFLEEKIKIKMVSKWRVGTGCGICPEPGATYPVQFQEYMPNPHLHHYACMGSFERDLSQAANDHNYVMAVDITSAENGNINWRDSIVMGRFMRDILTSNKHFLELPTGDCVTVLEAINWLGSQKTKEAEE